MFVTNWVAKSKKLTLLENFSFSVLWVSENDFFRQLYFRNKFVIPDHGNFRRAKISTTKKKQVGKFSLLSFSVEIFNKFRLFSGTFAKSNEIPLFLKLLRNTNLFKLRQRTNYFL